MCAIECLNKATQGAAKRYVEMLQCLMPCENQCGNTPGCKKTCPVKCNKQIQACSNG